LKIKANNPIMKKAIIKNLLLVLTASQLFYNCTKKEAVAPDKTNATKTDLEVNTWVVNNEVFKLSPYGFGWASTDFSPRAGWQYYSNTDNSSIEVSMLEKPIPAGQHTVETYSDVHLNKVRTQKITGNKVGIQVFFKKISYYSVASEKATITVAVANNKTSMVFKNVVLKELNTDKTIKVSANLEYTNQ
jgi:hypothetical protein